MLLPGVGFWLKPGQKPTLASFRSSFCTDRDFILNSRQSQVGQLAYRSRQSLSSPSPGGTEMDLLVMRERPRRGIRNSGYDVSPIHLALNT